MASTLQIYDLASSSAMELLVIERLIEAPNWIPDGASLIVNGDGRMFRVPLEAPKLIPIETGDFANCNNDHGISPDGESLVISDSTETGQSCIYVLPVSGGFPRRLTSNVPSWWHGWSPDGLTLAYV
ncbi:MAG: hypothetical protein RIC82_06935, partial [Parvibaculum sp.]